MAGRGNLVVAADLCHRADPPDDHTFDIHLHRTACHEDKMEFVRLGRSTIWYTGMPSIKQELPPIMEMEGSDGGSAPQEIPETSDKVCPYDGYLRAMFPRSCFDRSTLTSFAYLLRDVIYAALPLTWRLM